MGEEKIVEEKTVEEKSSEEKVVAEEKVAIVGKVTSVEVLKKWGPRTKGVLFRRQPDGTLINADLTEEQIARREERIKARIARELAKEEKRKERLRAKEKIEGD